MNLRHIEVFRALMTKGSVSAAAQFLNVSQPGVSRLIRNLEDRSSVRLFQRVKGRLEPTAEARILHEEVEGAFVRLERVRSLMVRLWAHQSGIVRIVAAPTIAHTLVLDRLLTIQQKRPNLQISIDYARFSGIARGLETGDFDFGVVIGDGAVPAFQNRRITTLRFGLAVPRGHRLSAREEVTIDDLAGEKIITYRRGSPLSEALSRLGLKPLLDTSRIEVGSSLIACGAVDRGYGLAIVDTDTIQRGTFANTIVVPLKPQFDVPVVAYFRREILSSAIAKATLQALCAPG